MQGEQVLLITPKCKADSLVQISLVVLTGPQFIMGLADVLIVHDIFGKWILFETHQPVSSVIRAVCSWNWTIRILTHRNIRRPEEVLVFQTGLSYDEAHFRARAVVVSAKNKWQAHLAKTSSQPEVPSCCIPPSRLHKPPAMPARSQFLSPAITCGHGELFPGDAPYPQVGPGGGFLLPSHFAEAQEPNLSAPVCLCEPQSWKPVPKCDQSLGGRKAAQLSVSLPAEEAGSHLLGASLYLRARPGSHFLLIPVPQVKWETPIWGHEASSPAQVELCFLVRSMPDRHSGSADLGKPSQDEIHGQTKKQEMGESQDGTAESLEAGRKHLS